MSNRAQLIKSIIKDTSDLYEDAALNQYLLSKGINPKYATKDQKVAHSKTSAFITWKNARMMEGLSMTHTPTQIRLHALKKSQHVNKEIRVADGHKQLHPQNEAVDKKDTVTLDIPLLIRVMELAREDLKSDMDLHRVVEKLINIRNKGMLTMKDYNYIAKIHEEIMPQVSPEVIEEAQQIDESDTQAWLADFNKNRPAHAQAKLDTRTAAQRKADTDKMLAARKKPTPTPVKPKPVSDVEIHKQIAKSYASHKPGQYVGDSVEHDDETMVEAQSAAVRWHKALQNVKKKREEQERRNKENAERVLAPKPKPVQEDKFQDPMAATQTVGMEVDNPSCSCDDKKSQRSKSARIIKSIYKRKNMKEELYDHEKEDKPTTSYGKKPKMSVTKPTDNVGENKPDAAAVLSGGKTLTGQPRDTIEIDPMMKKRPGSDPTGKNK